MIGRIVQCFGVERTPATSRFATGADLESAREQELAEEAALLRAENARLECTMLWWGSYSTLQ